MGGEGDPEILGDFRGEQGGARELLQGLHLQ